MSAELKKRAEQIRDETVRKANTAERVGGVMVDTVAELDTLKVKLEEFMGLTYISAIEVPAEGGGAVIGVRTMSKEWEVT